MIGTRRELRPLPVQFLLCALVARSSPVLADGDSRGKAASPARRGPVAWLLHRPKPTQRAVHEGGWLPRGTAETSKSERRAAARAARGSGTRYLEVIGELGGKNTLLGVISERRYRRFGDRFTEEVFEPRHPALKRGIAELRRYHEQVIAAASRRGAGKEANRMISVRGVKVYPSDPIALDIETSGKNNRTVSGTAYLDHRGKLLRVDWSSGGRFTGDGRFTGYSQAEQDVLAARGDRNHPLNRPPHTKIGSGAAPKFGETPPALLQGIETVRRQGAWRISNVATHHRGWTVTYQVRKMGKPETRSTQIGFDGQPF